MDFALGAILLIILLLPGVAIQNSYYSSLRQKQAGLNIPFSELLLRGLVFSLFLHTCGLYLVNHIFGVNISILYDAIEGKELNISNGNLSHLLEQFGVYNLSMCSIVWLLTKQLKHKIRENNLDMNFGFLQNSNYWFNIFSARYLETANIDGRQSDTDLILLDARVKGNIIYSGILYDFNYSQTKDELENIVLKSTVKRIYDHKEDNSNPIAIPGVVFIIPNSEIININVHYLNVQPTPKGGTP
jgi:hypothetical protein